MGYRRRRISGGQLPGLWTEWNGKFRDTVRDYWRGQPATLGEFASRLTGSSDLYEATGRRPSASINFVTAHDGFTLRDLVSYNEKHNEANGENNQDGETYNRSWNCGVEGPTDDPQILALRARQMRNIFATLVLSQGTPMLSTRRRDRPYAARQQQCLLPGFGAVLDGLGTRHRERRPAAVRT
ncbi:putative glycogen debranching enzyme domain protein [Mycobacteroides abscessus]|nr:putative glycogen debranching enzyme domain protein [Mycobacteroides abscessus]